MRTDRESCTYTSSLEEKVGPPAWEVKKIQGFSQNIWVPTRSSAKIFQAITEICEIFSDELARWRRGRLFLRSDISGLVFFFLAGLWVPIPSYVHFLSWIEK